MLSRLRLTLAVVVLLAMAAAGCGGDDGDDAAEPEATVADAEPTPTPAPTESAEPAPEPDEAAPDEDATPTPADDGIPDDGSAIPTPTQAPISGDPAFTAASKLTTVGLDELFFGDPVDFAAEVADTTWIGLAPEGQRPQCYTVQPQGGPAGIHFTVMDGFIERVDITNPIITTRSGAGVGFGEAELLELFAGSLEVRELDGGNEIAFVPTDATDRNFRIIWVTDGSAVVSMRAGRIPMVLPSSPCG